MLDNRERLLMRLVAPASEPVTLAEAKLYLRVDGISEDSLISDLMVAARMSAENWLKSSLITQKWKLIYNDYIDGAVFLPMQPVVSIDSVEVISRSGDVQAIFEDSYYLNASKRNLMFDNYISGFSIEITYTAGYGNASQVPYPIKYGILSHIATMYEERGNTEIPKQSLALYHPFREMML